jgi:GH25 family lysozyme M1 (1,4-beta-N-acetylmuramidase)
VEQAGLAIAYYHFADPDANPNPVDEVTKFFANLPDKEKPIALDIEIGNGPLQAWATIWMQEAAQRAGYKPYFYSGAWFMYPHLLHDNSDLNVYPLWLSHPDASSWPAPVPSWPTVKINQYGTGPVLGIAGNVDLNIYAGNLDEFIASGKP